MLDQNKATTFKLLLHGGEEEGPLKKKKKPPERSLALSFGSGSSSGRCHPPAAYGASAAHPPKLVSSVLQLPEVSQVFLNLNLP